MEDQRLSTANLLQSHAIQIFLWLPPPAKPESMMRNHGPSDFNFPRHNFLCLPRSIPTTPPPPRWTFSPRCRPTPCSSTAATFPRLGRRCTKPHPPALVSTPTPTMPSSLRSPPPPTPPAVAVPGPRTRNQRRGCPPSPPSPTGPPATTTRRRPPPPHRPGFCRRPRGSHPRARARARRPATEPGPCAPAPGGRRRGPRKAARWGGRFATPRIAGPGRAFLLAPGAGRVRWAIYVHALRLGRCGSDGPGPRGAGPPGPPCGLGMHQWKATATATVFRVGSTDAPPPWRWRPARDRFTLTREARRLGGPGDSESATSHRRRADSGRVQVAGGP
jgi:hypothetical protein